MSSHRAIDSTRLTVNRIPVAILLLLIMAIVWTPAMAGRNANGAMVVHTDDSVTFSAGTDYCSVDPLPATCEALNPNSTHLAGSTVVWLVAAFRPESSPGVTAAQFGIVHNMSGYFLARNACGPGVLEIPDANWPDGDGSGVNPTGTAIAFGAPVFDHVFKMYWFGLDTSGGPSDLFLSTTYYPASHDAEWADDSNPAQIDICRNFGTARWDGTGVNNCPQLASSGACCFADGHCNVLSQTDCSTQGGSYQGDNTVCEPNPCPQPTGACCFHDGSCTPLTQTECAAQGGTWQGMDTVCNPNPCLQPTGACCFHDGSCTPLTQTECAAQGGTWQGMDTVCNPNPCPPPTGACCFHDGSCTPLTQTECATQGGTWQGMDTVCNPNPCPPPIGGACCFADGRCAILGEAECQQLCGTYQGDNTVCVPNPCPPGGRAIRHVKTAGLLSNPFARKGGSAVRRAGRNAGGAMLLHVDNSVCYSTDADYCTLDPLPATCEQLVTNVTRDPISLALIWMVAAFPINSTPGVTAFQVGVTGDVPEGNFAAFGPCGPGALEIPDDTWPAPGTGTACAFANAVYGRLFKMYWFAAVAPTGSTFSTTNYPHGEGYAEWADDGNPPRIDICENFGRVVWGGEGLNQCPGPLLAGACCFTDGHCEVLRQVDCTGQFMGDNTVCDPNPCPQPTGACCFADGSCRVLTRTECEQQGGSYQADGTNCDPNLCPGPTGACCFHDGHCSVLTQGQCEADGGSYQGNSTPCDPNPCPQPTGACCFHDGHCTVLTQSQCQQQGGAWRGMDTNCDPNPCPQPTGACCFHDGHCTIETQSACGNDGGTWQGMDTACSPNPCPQPTGACCFVDGRCTILTLAQCDQQDGAYQGDDTSCSPNPCTHTGACCFHDGHCTILTESQCQQQGGGYHGDGITCDPNPCPPPPGACCFPDGHCDDITQTACSDQGGSWQGMDTVCSPNPCPQPIGACCFHDGHCTIETQSACAAQGGTWQGMATNCTPNPCPQPTGACCFVDGHCAILTLPQCQEQGGGYQGDDTSCDPNPCTHTGACCFHNGHCSILTESQCQQQGGSYQGDGAICIPNPCPQPTGACCFADGSCSDLTQVRCQELGGTYQGDGTSCAQTPCAPPPPTGACCLAGGGCTVQTQAACQAAGGNYQGDGTTCNPNPCTHSGACCFGTTCMILTQVQCTQQGGMYIGDNTSCSPNPCCSLAQSGNPKDGARPIPFVRGIGSPHVVGVTRDVCWSEPADLNGLIGSSEQILAFGLETELANDFIPMGSISHATWWGGFFNNSTPCQSGICTPGFNLRFYDDAGCVPGTVDADISITTFTEESVGCQQGVFPMFKWGADINISTVPGNLYWFGAQMKDHPFPPQAGRLASAGVVGCDTVFRSAYFAYPDWTPAIDVFGVAFDCSQEFTCGQGTRVQRTTWGRIKGMYH